MLKNVVRLALLWESTTLFYRLLMLVMLALRKMLLRGHIILILLKTGILLFLSFDWFTAEVMVYELIYHVPQMVGVCVSKNSQGDQIMQFFVVFNKTILFHLRLLVWYTCSYNQLGNM